MTWRNLLLVAGGLTVASLMGVACAAGGSEIQNSDGGSGSVGGTGGVGGTGAGGEGAGFNVGGGSGGADPNEIAEVYGHSPDTLYVLVPETKEVSVVAPFNGCQDIVDIAIDENNEIIATADFSSAGLYSVDKQTASCTLIKSGAYPNSLSYVPAGTLDPNVEALVGYDETDYVRIDPSSGSVTVVNPSALTDGYVSSGDIVSVKGGGTYLTIKGDGPSGNCNDCIVQVNPATGTIIQNFGDAGASQIFGLAYWGGKAYGFTNGGQLFAIDFQGANVTATPIAIPNAPADLKFWGAGSSTSVPVEVPK